MSGIGQLQIRAMNGETLSDCRRLWSTSPEGWCWCVAWEVPTWDGWGERSASENQQLRESLWARNEFYGYLLYAGEEQLIGWIRVGPAEYWPKLVKLRKIAHPGDVYAITCMGIKPEYRRQGFLRPALGLVIEQLKAQGVEQIVAYPKIHKGAVDDGALWNGLVSVYRDLGFATARTEQEYCEMRLSFRN